MMNLGGFLLMCVSLWGTPGVHTQCPSCNLAVGIHSNLTETTTSGGSVTFTCHRTVGEYKDSWYYHHDGHPLPIGKHLFNKILGHISYNISSVPSTNEIGMPIVLFSLTLSNLEVSENNVFITCQSSNSSNSCTIYPMQPFILLVVEPTSPETTAAEDQDTTTNDQDTTAEVEDTTAEATTSPPGKDSNCPTQPAANCSCINETTPPPDIVVDPAQQINSCNSTSAMFSTLVYILGPTAAVIIAVETIVICIGLMLRCTQKSSKERDLEVLDTRTQGITNPLVTEYHSIDVKPPSREDDVTSTAPPIDVQTTTNVTFKNSNVTN